MPSPQILSGLTVLALSVLLIGLSVAFLIVVWVPRRSTNAVAEATSALAAPIPAPVPSPMKVAEPVTVPAEARTAVAEPAVVVEPTIVAAPPRIAAAPAKSRGFEVTYRPGSRDSSGRFMGGTEMRVLVPHAGKLYAGNGYWVDRPGPEGPQGAQIMVLEGPDAQWRVDHTFEERLADGRRRDIAVSTLATITFSTDGSGRRLEQPISMLIESNWDQSGQARYFTRNDADGVWTGIALPVAPGPDSDRLPQVRSFALHRDGVTGIDLVFVGLRPNGILSGTYEASAPGRIRFADTPELDLAVISETALPGAADLLRISSFAECNDRLYAAIGQQIYERVDGATPHWRLIYTNPSPGRSQTGLRGLTAMMNPAGPGQVLIAAIEGTAGRIVRIDPRDGSEATDLDLKPFLSKAWGMPVGYTITAYNDFAKIKDRQGREVLLTGFEAFIPPDAKVAPGHRVVDIGKDRHIESGAWYLIRHPDGHYDLRAVSAEPEQNMFATRSIVASPFPNDGDALYFGGYDANRFPVHNTAWLLRADLETAIGPAR